MCCNPACHPACGPATQPALPPALLQDERERQARRAAEVAKLRGEREVQLGEQANRKLVAAELRRRGDAELSARVALDVKKQMEVGRGGWQRDAAPPGCARESSK